jgi:hypothetical protein
LLCLISSIEIQAQNTPSFKEQLSQVETKFNVKFSFANSSIEKIQIDETVRLTDFSSVDEVIEYLNENTFLNVVKIDDRYISLALKKDLISICGYLLDENNLPIVNASIYVFGKNQGTISNDQGYFELSNLEISDYLEISHLSFEDQLKNVNSFYRKDQGCTSINLLEEGIVLEDILIKNYILKSLDKTSDGTIRMNTSKFGILGGQVEPDLLQTSQILPGVEAQDESIANLNVRNGASDQNIIYWDNVKMYHASHFFGLISAINPYLTEHISIVKSGTSAAFNDGVSSSFFLETDQQVKEKLRAGAGINMISADAFVKVPVTKNIQFNASFRKSINNFLRTPTYESYFEKTFQNNEIGRNTENTDFSFYDVNLNTVIKLEDKHTARFNYIRINNQLFNRELPGSSLEDKIDQNTQAVGFLYDYKASDRLNLQLNAYHTLYSLETDNYQNDQQQLLRQGNEVNENSVKALAFYNFNEKSQLQLGYQLTETGVTSDANINDPRFIRIQKGVLINHSGFGEFTFQNDQLFARAGLRYNYFDKIDEQTWEPRINLVYHVSKSFDLIANYEQKSQYTSQVIDFLDDFLGVENRRWVIVDENIPLITSRQFAAGFGFKKNKYLIDLTFYHKQTDGILISGQGFQNQVLDRRLIGDQRSYGVEVLVNKRFQHLNVWTSYTFGNSELLFPEIQQTYFPASSDIRNSLTLGLKYSFNEELNLSFIFNSRSGRPYSIPVAGNETTQNGNFTVVNYDSLNAERLPTYNRLDASLSYSKKLNNLSLTLKAGILNTLNSNQVLQRYYIVDESDSSRAQQIDIHGLGVTPNVTLRIAF